MVELRLLTNEAAESLDINIRIARWRVALFANVIKHDDNPTLKKIFKAAGDDLDEFIKQKRRVELDIPAVIPVFRQSTLLREKDGDLTIVAPDALGGDSQSNIPAVGYCSEAASPPRLLGKRSR
jgi:hypothetical protein